MEKGWQENIDETTLTSWLSSEFRLNKVTSVVSKKASGAIRSALLCRWENVEREARSDEGSQQGRDIGSRAH